MLKINSYAKLNLSLEVIGKFDDGYHEIKSIMQTIDIYDSLEFYPSNNININVLGNHIPIQNNLVYKAVMYLKNLYLVKEGINIKIVKNGGWHFTNIRNAENLHNKMTNFAHHQEYEESNFSKEDMEKFIKEKLIFYDHFVDKSKNKFETKIKLEIADKKILPKYLIKNLEKYKNWID